MTILLSSFSKRKSPMTNIFSRLKATRSLFPCLRPRSEATMRARPHLGGCRIKRKVAQTTAVNLYAGCYDSSLVLLCKQIRRTDMPIG